MQAFQYKRRSIARLLLPEAVAILGVPQQFVLADGRDNLFTWWSPVGAILCANGDGDEMFLLSPMRGAGTPRSLDVALHVEGLYERFTHRKADGFYNAFCPAFSKPQFRGYIKTIRYNSDKDIDDDGSYEIVGYEHDFEPGEYPELHSVGATQYYIPRGAWRITAEGIVNTPRR